jgi:hypothetical protein
VQADFVVLEALRVARAVGLLVVVQDDVERDFVCTVACLSSSL